MRLGLAYNQRPDLLGDRSSHLPSPDHPATTVDAYVEWDEPSTIDAVARALSVFGDVVRLEATDGFAARLAASRVDLLFNMAEGLRGPSREAHVPAIAEFLGVPYTASDPLTLCLALHKGRTKEVLAQRGIPTAPFVTIETLDDLPRLRTARGYPLFLKPAWEGSSKGISQANRVDNPVAAADRARYLLETYRQPVVAESYLPGEEFTVAVYGTGAEAVCLPLIRYRFDHLPAGALPIMGYEAKWEWDTPEAALDILECPAHVIEPLAARIREVALGAYRALGCRDWGRVDVRLDAACVPHVVEVNPLPGIIPDLAANSCFPRAAIAAGMTYDEMIQRVVQLAWRRLHGTDLVIHESARAEAAA
jgi:D-alanine-D-alanine ligase